MALRQQRPDQYQYEEYIPKEKQAKYQEYSIQHSHTNRLKEVLFFVNVVLFSILTVLTTYVYLSMKIPVFLSFVLGIATGLIGLRVIQIAMRNHYFRMKQKRRSK
ncbi:DUF3270 domain-containing protein [Streptococcus cameli]